VIIPDSLLIVSMIVTLIALWHALTPEGR